MTDRNYIFRPASGCEVYPVFELVKKRVQWMDEKGIRQWNVTGYLEAYPVSYYEERQKEGQLYILLSGSTVCGAAVLSEEDDRWQDRAEDTALYVHNLVTDATISSAGRQLLAEAEQLAKKQGKRYVRLDCAIDNAFLNRYYASQGFQLAGLCRDGPYQGNRREKEIKQ